MGANETSDLTNLRVRLDRARLSLDGLSIGDALGEMFSSKPTTLRRVIQEGTLPPSPWWRTDDTEMASSREEYYRPYGGAAAFGQPGYFSGDDSAAISRPGVAPPTPKQKKYDPMET